MYRTTAAALLIAICGFAGRTVLAQGIGNNDSATPLLAASRVEDPIAIDGLLEEPAWDRADVATGFRQLEPLEGSSATQQTEVRVLYGETSIYIGASLFDDDPGRIQQILGRRDEYTRADWFAVSIDSHLDRKTAFQFGVNAAGVEYDAIRAEDVETEGGPAGGGDPSWNAIWDSAVQVTSEGWFVEIEIPYSMLRFSQADQQTWGIHFSREIQRLGERTEWPLVPRVDRANLVARFGRLHGISGIEPRRDVQISPYTLSRLRTTEDPSRTGRLASDGSVDAGVDLKVGLGSNVTLNATINPDFGQIESDPAELNLTAFETFFAEKRPFFLEGMQIYQFPLIGNSSLLYTRRIGSDAPILGALKLSGRTAGGLSFGALSAATGERLNSTRRYGAVRVSQQIGAFSSVGGMVTGVGGSSLSGRRGAVAGGADWDFRLKDNLYSVRGFAAFSHRFDLQTGFTGQIMAAKRQGMWTYEFGGDFVDAHFDPNDIGWQQRNNAAGAIIRFGHDLLAGRPFGPFQRAELEGSTWQQWSYDEGIRLGGSAGVDSEWILQGFETIELGVEVSNPFGGYDLFETRGLWPAPNHRSFDAGASFQTDDRRAWHIEPEAEFSLLDDGGRMYRTGLEGMWNVRSHIALSGQIDVEWGDGTLEWAANEMFRRTPTGWEIGTRANDPGLTNDFAPVPDGASLDDLLARVEPDPQSGNYFVPVYGFRDTRAIDVILRAGYTFTPDLVLQLYGQIFAARGRYSDFRILQNPDMATAFDEFPKRYEFIQSSFHLNTVLRWEYRPGSVLYVVWTQERSDDDDLNPLGPWGTSPYRTSFPNQISDTFRIFPRNVFMVKLNYTFLY